MEIIDTEEKKRRKERDSPNVGQGVPSGPEVVVTPQFSDAPLFGLHPGLRRGDGTGDHVVLVSGGAGRRDASARAPTRSAATSAAWRRRFFLVMSARKTVHNALVTEPSAVVKLRIFMHFAWRNHICNFL